MLYLSNNQSFYVSRYQKSLGLFLSDFVFVICSYTHFKPDTYNLYIHKVY